MQTPGKPATIRYPDQRSFRRFSATTSPRTSQGHQALQELVLRGVSGRWSGANRAAPAAATPARTTARARPPVPLPATLAAALRPHAARIDRSRSNRCSEGSFFCFSFSGSCDPHTPLQGWTERSVGFGQEHFTLQGRTFTTVAPSSFIR